uniref:Uncharacterized protein n=1 Tax=Rhizophora mucronata TaxID=61149 RepID=A0A2P2QLW7_RHIMU
MTFHLTVGITHRYTVGSVSGLVKVGIQDSQLVYYLISHWERFVILFWTSCDHQLTFYWSHSGT